MGVLGDVESLDTIKAAEDHLGEVIGELLTRATASLNGQVNNASSQFSNLIRGVLVGLQDQESKAVADIHGILDRLDGAKVLFVDGGFQLNIPARVKT
jgi:hypothetical protein